MIKKIIFGLTIFAITKISSAKSAFPGFTGMTAMPSGAAPQSAGSAGVKVKINKSFNKNAIGVSVLTVGGNIEAVNGSTNNINNSAIAASNNVRGTGVGTGGNLINTQIGSLNI
jgi:hypothetical protein